MNQLVSLGSEKQSGLWSWTELALNPSSATSGLDVLVGVQPRVSGPSPRKWAP